MMNALLISSSTPNNLWGEALLTTCKIFKKLIEYQIIELKNNEDVLVESNYWKRFCPIKILAIF